MVRSVHFVSPKWRSARMSFQMVSMESETMAFMAWWSARRGMPRSPEVQRSTMAGVQR